MSTQVYPSGTAGTSTDTRILDTALLQGPHPTQNYDMPANEAVVRYELVRMVGKNLAKIVAAPAAGDVVGVVVWNADNLTATAANLRSAKVDVYVGGEFDESRLTIGSGTADDWRAIAMANGIKFSKPHVYL